MTSPPFGSVVIGSVSGVDTNDDAVIIIRILN